VNQLITREILNAQLSILMLGISFVLILRVASFARSPGFFTELGNKIAIVLSGIFIGEAIYRAWLFGILWGIEEDGGSIGSQYWVAFAAGLVITWCGLCLIWLFAPPRWRLFSVLAVGLASLSAGVYVTYEKSTWL
jgi:hypothetical protein